MKNGFKDWSQSNDFGTFRIGEHMRRLARDFAARLHKVWM